MLMCAGDELIANKSSIVGSIGVISASFGFKDLIEKIGVKRRIFTAGENKSFLDPFVDVQDKDVEKLIKVQTSIFKNFKALVLKNRKEKIEADKVCNGEFWTGEQAIDLGLVDSNDALVDYLDNNYGKNYRLRPIESKKSFLKGIFSSRSNATDSISGLVAFIATDMAVEKSDDLVALCKRRGFIFQSDEIYGGQKGLYTFGPMGVELKNNLKQAWWKTMVWQRDDVEGLDASLLTSPNVLKYSGHEDTFTDPLCDCKDCKSRWREDQLNDKACPGCGSKNLTEPRPFNLMFKTAIGPVDDGSSFVYLRPETAQQIFTNFKNVLDSTSRSVPFGIGQTGKSFRNEITPWKIYLSSA